MEAAEQLASEEKLFVMGKVLETIQALQESSGEFLKDYKDILDVCGEAFFWCGKALLDLARLENALQCQAQTETSGEVGEEDDQESDKENNNESPRVELNVRVSSAEAEENDDDAEKDGKESEDAEKDGEESEDAEKDGEELEKDGEEPEDAEKDGEEPEDAEKDGEESEDAENDGKEAEDAEEDGKEAENAKKDGKEPEHAEKDGKEPEDAEKNGEEAGDAGKDGKEAEDAGMDGKGAGDAGKDGKLAVKPDFVEEPRVPEDVFHVEDEEDCIEEDIDEQEETSTAETGSEAEMVENLQFAWEMFEVTKFIYKSKDKAEDQLSLAHIHLKLGEVYVEAGNYEKAVKDFTECLELQRKFLEPHNWLIAQTFYRLGVTHALSGQPGLAIQALNNSIAAIESRLDNLQSLLDIGGSREDLVEEKAELEQLLSLLPKIQEELANATADLNSERDSAVEDMEDTVERSDEGEKEKKENNDEGISYSVDIGAETNGDVTGIPGPLEKAESTNEDPAV